jgi:hypothetical protein
MATWFKRSFTAVALGATALLLSSCGGGGTQGGDPLKVGSLALQPSAANFYALNPVTLQIAGGRPPYNISTSEPTVIPSNFQLTGNTWNFTPNQPGVVDPTTDPNEVPSRSVTVTVRDANGDQTTGTYKVLQNFLVGYGLSIATTTTCGATATGGTGGAAATTVSVEACAGSDSLVSLVPISNGLRYAGKQMRVSVNYGPFAFIQDDLPCCITGPTYTRNADSAGLVTARIRVLPNAVTQYAQFKLIDVATGAYRDVTFTIRNASPSALSVIPSDLTFTGATSAQCGFGGANVYPLGGKAPYRASVTNPNIQITPSVVNTGDAFLLQVGPSTTCISASAIVTDAEGKTATVAVKTEAGTTAPVLPLTANPAAVGCMPDTTGVAQITISGGGTNKVIAISNPSLLLPTPVSGTGTFVLQLNAQGAGGASLQNVTVTVSDGSATPATITIGRKTTCP